MTLLAVHTADGVDEADVLRLAGALEHAYEHPIAHAVAKGAEAKAGRTRGGKRRGDFSRPECTSRCMRDAIRGCSGRTRR